MVYPGQRPQPSGTESCHMSFSNSSSQFLISHSSQMVTRNAPIGVVPVLVVSDLHTG